MMELSKLLPDLIYETVKFLNIIKKVNCKVFTLGAHSSFVAKTINNHYLSGGSEGLTLDGKFISEAIKLENDIINDGSVHPSGESLIFGSRDYCEFFEKGLSLIHI